PRAPGGAQPPPLLAGLPPPLASAASTPGRATVPGGRGSPRSPLPVRRGDRSLPGAPGTRARRAGAPRCGAAPKATRPRPSGPPRPAPGAAPPGREGPAFPAWPGDSGLSRRRRGSSATASGRAPPGLPPLPVPALAVPPAPARGRLPPSCRLLGARRRQRRRAARSSRSSALPCSSSARLWPPGGPPPKAAADAIDEPGPEACPGEQRPRGSLQALLSHLGVGQVEAEQPFDDGEVEGRGRKAPGVGQRPPQNPVQPRIPLRRVLVEAHEVQIVLAPVLRLVDEAVQQDVKGGDPREVRRFQAFRRLVGSAARRFRRQGEDAQRRAGG